MSNQHQQYEGLSREDILNLKMGEVIRYRGGYLTVADVDVERGVVTGRLEDQIYGVNALPIEELEETGIEVTKWQRK